MRRPIGPSRIAACLVGAVLAAVLVVLLPGSASAADSGGTPPGKAWIRAGHFVPGMGPVSIRLTPQDGSAMTLAQQVSYGSVTGYRQVDPGTYTVTVNPEGAAADSQPMLRRALTVTSGKASTVALLGKQSAPRLAVLNDDLTPPDPGTARVRVLSGTAGASALSIKAVDGPDIASGVVLGQTTGYASVPDGSWTLAIDARDAQSSRATVELKSGGVYTVVVLDRGQDSPSSVRLRLVTDAQGVARTPKGGAATGLGGLANQGGPRSGPGDGLGLVVLGALGVAVLIAASAGVRRGAQRPASNR